MLAETDWPIAGGVHFGFIAEAYRAGTPAPYYVNHSPSTASTPGLTVLEDGTQILDTQWTVFSANPTLGTALNLPQAYGFAAVSTGLAKVDAATTHLAYTTTAAGLGATYQALLQTTLPPGFGAAGANAGTLKVVMDKDRARVYAYAGNDHAWVPVLWLDRFGHYVTFRWDRATTGLPSDVRTVTKVTALNQRNQGVVLRWAAVNGMAVVDLGRLDYVGIPAPSVLIRGYSCPTSITFAHGDNYF